MSEVVAYTVKLKQIPDDDDNIMNIITKRPNCKNVEYMFDLGTTNKNSNQSYHSQLLYIVA